MSDYIIYFTATAVTDVKVKADTYDEAYERAWDEFDVPAPCHEEEYDLSDWEVDHAASDPDFDEHRSTQRTRTLQVVADQLMLNRGPSAGEMAELLAEKGLLNLSN